MPDVFNILDNPNRALYRSIGMDPTVRAEPAPRWGMTGGLVLVSGTVYMCFVRPIVPLTITKLISSTNSAASTTPTLERMGLYRYDGGANATLLARCASETTLWNATFADRERALDATGGYPTSYSLAADGTVYGLAMIFTGTTGPNMRCFFQNTAAATGQRDPVLAAISSGKTDLPASLTDLSTSVGNIPWMAAGV